VKLKKIVATFKLSKDGGLELFHKEDEDSLYAVCRRSAKYVDGRSYCSICQYYYPAEENKYRCPYVHTFKNITEKKGEITETVKTP
jgi:hypothetical protein